MFTILQTKCLEEYLAYNRGSINVSNSFLHSLTILALKLFKSLSWGVELTGLCWELESHERLLLLPSYITHVFYTACLKCSWESKSMSVIEAHHLTLTWEVQLGLLPGDEAKAQKYQLIKTNCSSWVPVESSKKRSWLKSTNEGVELSLIGSCLPWYRKTLLLISSGKANVLDLWMSISLLCNPPIFSVHQFLTSLPWIPGFR